MTPAPEPSAGESAWAVRAAGLTRRFGTAAALRDVDLCVGWGERIALLGANGAGKTTLLRILAALTRPSAGRVSVAGIDVAHGPGLERARRLVGFAGHQTYLYEDLTIEENLAFYARLYGGVPLDAQERLLRRGGLWERRHQRVRALSRGLQQRGALARALLHDPPLLLLDEPDAGLDANGLAWLAEIVADRCRTVVMTTHTAERARAWCGRMVVLERGMKVSDGPVGGATRHGSPR